MNLSDWITAYGRAWETGDQELMLSLFTEDASYRSSPLLGLLGHVSCGGPRVPCVGVDRERDALEALVRVPEHLEGRCERRRVAEQRLALALS